MANWADRAASPERAEISMIWELTDRTDRDGAWVDFMKERTGRHGPKRHFADFRRVSAYRGAEREEPVAW